MQKVWDFVKNRQNLPLWSDIWDVSYIELWILIAFITAMIIAYLKTYRFGQNWQRFEQGTMF